MKVSELVALLAPYPELDVCIDVDDGCKRNYRDLIAVKLRMGALGEAFIALDAQFEEENRGLR